MLWRQTMEFWAKFNKALLPKNWLDAPFCIPLFTEPQFSLNYRPKSLFPDKSIHPILFLRLFFSNICKFSQLMLPVPYSLRCQLASPIRCEKERLSCSWCSRVTKKIIIHFFSLSTCMPVALLFKPLIFLFRGPDLNFCWKVVEKYKNSQLIDFKLSCDWTSNSSVYLWLSHKVRW